MQVFIEKFSFCNDVVTHPTVEQTENGGFGKNASKLGKLKPSVIVKPTERQD